jgi:hypothetical protein
MENVKFNAALSYAPGEIVEQVGNKDLPSGTYTRTIDVKQTTNSGSKGWWTILENEEGYKRRVFAQPSALTTKVCIEGKVIEGMETHQVIVMRKAGSDYPDYQVNA